MDLVRMPGGTQLVRLVLEGAMVFGMSVVGEIGMQVFCPFGERHVRRRVAMVAEGAPQHLGAKKHPS